MTASEPHVDCDVHCAPATFADLLPYLEDYWHEYLDDAQLELVGPWRSYPKGMTNGPAPTRYEELAEGLLADSTATHVILNSLVLHEINRNPYFSSAIARATNDWLREHWLDRDPRLRASIHVSPLEPDLAAEEVERLAGDRRFVQVVLPVRMESPCGLRRFDILHAAAERHGLPIALHAWGLPGTANTPSGIANTFLDDYASNSQLVHVHIFSLIAEGVFERHPRLRIALLECGFSWLAPLLWRLDKEWKGIHREVPWVKRRPSDYVLEQFRATTQPAFLPVDDDDARAALAMMDTGWLMYASDHPHRHGEQPQRLLALLGDDQREAVLRATAASFYRLDA